MNLALNSWARDLGWTIAGVAAPAIPEQRQTFYRDWIERLTVPGMKYLKVRARERLDPKSYFPNVKSILCFGLSYFPGWAQGEVKVSNYAWQTDYHQLLKERLEKTVIALQELIGPFEYRIAVDTSPVLEKIIATEAGLGWQGKNTLLIHRQHGSLLFLGEIFTNLDIALFEQPRIETDHCGTCQRCLVACPTQALKPYELIAEKCISYWTLEHKGPFSAQTPPWESWIAGCDICQEVCPWNQRLVPLPSPFADLQNLSPSDIEHPTWPERIAPTALSYVPKENWQRNLEHLRKFRQDAKSALESAPD